MTSQGEIWKITIIFRSTDSVSLCTSEHACKTAYDQWIDRMVSFSAEGTDGDLIEVQGMTDTADKAPMQVACLASEVKAITVLRMY